jgi:hypothetical protein
MTDKRDMLRHYLAAIAYRLQKALRDMPESFPAFRAGSQTRSPHELVCHIRSVLGYARTHFIGGVYDGGRPEDFKQDLAALHDMLEDLNRHLSATPLLDTTEERLLQGPFSDAMTHVGQIAMLRRLAGSPVPPENFIVADVSVTNLGTDQPDPVSPDADWPDRPES